MLNRSLTNSVACVLKDDGSVAGTAFLFKKGEESCYWFTCHHVIAPLRELRIGTKFSNGEYPPQLQTDAEHVTECSKPDKDIAVLKTGLDPDLEHFEPLPMGNFAPKTNTYPPPRVSGVGFTPTNINNYPCGRIFSAELTVGQDTHFPLHSERETRLIDQLGGSWNVAVSEVFNEQVLNVRNSEVAIESGFSGSPICRGSTCIGMVHQQPSLGKEKEAKAIGFDELLSAAGTVIPFQQYADCVVLVLAAKRDEMEQYLKNSDRFLTKFVSSKNYAPDDRNKWQAFNRSQKSLELLLDDVHSEKYTWQLSTSYLDTSQKQELERYIIEARGALLFIVDGSSVEILTLKAIIEDADRQYHRAAYLFPVCEERFLPDIRRKLIQHCTSKMPHVFHESPSMNARREECRTPDDFKKRFTELIDKAVILSMTMANLGNPDNRAKLLEANILESYTGSRPTLNPNY